MAVGLGVAVVETATAVVVGAVEDRVLALGIVAGRDAVGVVVTVPGTRSDVDAIGLVSVDRDWCALASARLSYPPAAGPLNPPGGAWVRLLPRPDWS